MQKFWILIGILFGTALILFIPNAVAHNKDIVESLKKLDTQTKDLGDRVERLEKVEPYISKSYSGGGPDSNPPIEDGLLAFSIDNNGKYSKLSDHSENDLSGHNNFTMFVMFKRKDEGEDKDKEGRALQTPMGFIHIKAKGEGVAFVIFKDRKGRAYIDNNAQGAEKRKAYYCSANVAVDRKWHSAALVADNQKFMGYFDGIKYSLEFQGTGLSGDYRFICVGYSKYQGNESEPVEHVHFSGDIKKIAIYNRALNVREIRALTNHWRN